MAVIIAEALAEATKADQSYTSRHGNRVMRNMVQHPACASLPNSAADAITNIDWDLPLGISQWLAILQACPGVYKWGDKGTDEKPRHLPEDHENPRHTSCVRAVRIQVRHAGRRPTLELIHLNVPNFVAFGLLTAMQVKRLRVFVPRPERVQSGEARRKHRDPWRTMRRETS